MEPDARPSSLEASPGSTARSSPGTHTRQHRHYVPISVRFLKQFREAGFILREDIVKVQHKMKSARERWSGSKYDFYLTFHEHLFMFRKIADGGGSGPPRSVTRETCTLK